MLTRTIPSSGEKLPVIGLGTWRAFDVDLSADIRRQLADVLSLFVKLGGRVIDSSPMYGRAEEVIGDLTSATWHSRETVSRDQSLDSRASRAEFSQWNVPCRFCARTEST